ncbi:MAG: hypothetical protein HY300_17965 [Verrucomicrobia bacterium]|nr:hypothetical protein [Verrucomicrobiota bacterium]
MSNAEVAQQLSAIRSLIKRSSAATGTDLELQAHWARYACVLAAGLLENAIVALYSDFASRNAQKPVADYAAVQLEKIQNPKAARFVDVARSFKISWAEDLETFLEQNGRKEAIDAIMANRHLIAHGQHSGITVARVSNYLDKSEEVLAFIEKQTI